MTSESLQHTLDRVRRPRVQITYDVETGGAMEKKELPFVVGVMADLSGHPIQEPKALKERKFIPIDRDNFNDVLEKATPRLAMRIYNRLTDDDSQLAVELSFKNMDDFEPAQVAGQIPALKKLLDVRLRLSELLGKMEGNDQLDHLLTKVIEDSQNAKSLADELGATAEGSGNGDPDTSEVTATDVPETE